MRSIQEERFGLEIEKEKKVNRKQLVRILILVVAVFAVVLAIQSLIKENVESLAVTNDLNAAWISSVASYWGGVIGGCISGTLTIVGVVWTIKYYKDSDSSKTRVEHMPFLMFELKETFEATDEKCKGENIYTINRSNKGEIETVLCRMKISNIGRDFASVLVLHTGENLSGVMYHELLKAGDIKEIGLKILYDKSIDKKEISFGIQYIDCMRNEYIQKYLLCWSDDIYDMRIEQGYPKFIK